MSAKHLVLSIFSALAAIKALPAAAQDYPAGKTIRFIVPFPPGGGTDILSRVITGKLRETAKWSIVVENKPGAGGNIGADLIAKSPPDGSTIGLGQTANLAVNPTLYGTLPYDSLTDFAPVVMVADVSLVIVVNAGSSINTLADLIAIGKSKPGTLNFATPGNGTSSHLSGELLQVVSGAKFLHIPYRGAAQALTDLLGARADLMMSSAPSASIHIKSGKLRVLAVTSAKRAGAMPEVATVAEQGYPGFEATSWYGVLAPAGTPPAIVARLNAEINGVLQLAEVQDKIAADGGIPVGGSPEQFAATIKSEHAKWGRVVRESGAKLD
jgi:tripartite-type tricarboxylate transporter receptor subunit TctC